MQGLFLGAGASYELGMPLVWELTEILKRDHSPDLLSRLKNNQSAGSAMHWSDEALGALQSLLADNELHYEAVIGAIEVEAQRRHGPQESYERIRLHLVDMVSRYLINQHGHDLKFTASGIKYTNGLAKFIEHNKPLNIFSLNHDVMIEEICTHLEKPLKSGFRRNTEYWSSAFSGATFNFQFETLTKDEMKSGEFDFFKLGEEGVNLYKLHGALDTFLFNSCKDFVRFYPEENTSGGHIRLLTNLNNENHRIELEDGIRSIEMMTLKDSFGVAQFFDRSLITGAFKFQSKHSRKKSLAIFFEKFKSDIYAVQELTCAGYSFGDLHVNKVITDWLCSSTNHHLTIVDPFCKTTPAFLLHLKNQIDIQNKTFLDLLRDTPSTAEEKLERFMHKQFREYRRLQNTGKI